MSDGVISKIQLPNENTYDIVDNTSGYITGMTILSYGSSTWNDFITAYNANKVVYCRASSNSNPASGSQTRLAFMAYVNNATTPTEVEFQYYRSVSSHSDSQQGDQVYVYKINSAGTWSVTVRSAFTKINVGGDLSKSYSNGTLTLSATIPTVPTNVSAFTNDAGYITSYTETDPVFSASAAAGITSNDISNWNAKVSDDHKWGDVSLNKTIYANQTTYYVPFLTEASDTQADLVQAKAVPTAKTIAVFDENAYLKSTTPSANDNSTKVATTAYVDGAIGSITIPTKTSDLTNDSGFITSYTDEKVKAIAINSTTNTTYQPVISTTTNNAETKLRSGNLKFTIYDASQCWLSIGESGSSNGKLRLYTTTAGGYTTLQSNATTGRYITFPDAAGTVALTSDIPTVPTKTSDLTNDSGFITGYTETDPVFTSSAAHGISASDITNWNSKQAALVSGTNIKTINNQSILTSGNIDTSTVSIVRW